MSHKKTRIFFRTFCFWTCAVADYENEENSRKNTAFCNNKNIRSENFDSEITIVWTMCVPDPKIAVDTTKQRKQTDGPLYTFF